MNKYFVNIKVDREERPDLDHLYMTVVQMLTQSGGWPMSVWLTPELKPFFGGTYFPPDDRYGRPGFPVVLTELGEAWKKHEGKMLESAQGITKALEERMASTPGKEKLPEASKVMASAFQMLEHSFDPIHGGFGTAPKFPMPVYQDFLLTHYARTGEKKALDMAATSIREMAEGGIFDQLGGGFARYSTDPKWVVPHFEKMLYDNAQLISNCVGLYQATGQDFFKRVASESISYILRDMTHPEGGFYSAEDADSEGKEGTFYLWTLAEIKKILDPETAEAFIDRFGVTVNGNFMDPHTGDLGQNILVQEKTVEKVAEKFGKPVGEMEKILSAAKEKLFQVRSKRPRPHLDDKILTGWNGLMISALAQAGAVFDEPKYLQAAEAGAAFIEKNLYDAPSHELYRRWRQGDRKILAFQADYAYLIQGLLDLFEGTGNPHWLEWAVSLQERQDQLFFDPKDGGYFLNLAQSDVLVRMKDDHDNVVPAGGSVAALNGIRLGHMLMRKEFTERAESTIRAFANSMEQYPPGYMKLLLALDFLTQGNVQVVVVGPAASSQTRALSWSCFGTYLPGKVVIPVQPGNNQDRLAKMIPFIGSMKMIDNQAAAYVCINYSCRQPTADPGEFKKQIAAAAKIHI